MEAILTMAGLPVVDSGCLWNTAVNGDTAGARGVIVSDDLVDLHRWAVASTKARMFYDNEKTWSFIAIIGFILYPSLPLRAPAHFDSYL